MSFTRTPNVNLIPRFQLLDSSGNPIATVNNGHLKQVQYDSSGNELFNSIANRGYVQLSDGVDVAAIDGTFGTLRMAQFSVAGVAQFGHDAVIEGVDISAHNSFGEQASASSGSEHQGVPVGLFLDNVSRRFVFPSTKALTTVRHVQEMLHTDSNTVENFGLSAIGGMVNTDQQKFTLYNTTGGEIKISANLIDAISMNRNRMEVDSVMRAYNGSTSDALRADANKNLKTAIVSQSDEVARGNVTGEKNLDKFGFNDAIPNSYEDISSKSANISIATYLGGSAVAMDMITTGVDTIAGTGAQKVTIEGVDGNGDEQTEVLDTNAGTQALANNYLWINRAYVSQAGTGQTNANVITFQTNAAAVFMTEIPADYSQTQTTLFYVPNDYTELLIRRFSATAGRADDIKFRLMHLASPTSAWRVARPLNVYQRAYDEEFHDAPISIPANSLIKVQGKLGTGTGVGSASYQGLLK